MSLGPIPFIQARWYTQGTPDVRRHDWIVLHTMEIGERGDTAEVCARMFQNLPATRKASAHYCIGNTSIVHTVDMADVAYGAPGANRRGIHLEHAGTASQTAAEWADAYSQAMLKLSAQLCREVIVPKFNIPVVFVDAAGLRAGHRGITTHAECSKAFPPNAGHWDPGPHFPMAQYLAWVKAAP